jgi:hypothetical protein
MSGVTLSKPLREYVEAMRVYHAAVAEWLGLDVESIFKFTTSNDRGYKRVVWDAIAKQEPRLGYIEHGARGDEQGITFTGVALLDHPEALALFEAVGPEPTPPWANVAPEIWRALYNA